MAETLRAEWVVRVDGKVQQRPDGTENPDLPTGAVEVYVREIEVLGQAGELPMPSSVIKNIPKRYGSNTAFSICAARSCTRTS